MCHKFSFTTTGKDARRITTHSKTGDFQTCISVITSKNEFAFAKVHNYFECDYT